MWPIETVCQPLVIYALHYQVIMYQFLFFFKIPKSFFKKNYLFIWLCWVLVEACGIFVVACRIFHCGMRALCCGVWASLVVAHGLLSAQA